MNKELLIKAMSLFDTSEKWNAFCQLIDQDKNIQNEWWEKLQKEVYHREMKNSIIDWDIHIWNHWDIMWFIKGENNRSLAIHYWGKTLRVFCDYGDLDLGKVNELLKKPKFDVIKNCFDRIDGSNDKSIAWEDGNFSFETTFDGNFSDYRTLAWYAGNRTEDYANQLIKKVRKFQTTEITELFKEINNTCRK
ncbi:hypothetical protein [Tenacibaculum haliotis]|uniref:hypothetical protein n=1 Tax=Tenacibaculum haliotis TaxID=1888914 RepID=UPI0021AFB82A|nr:hypothetical protein [Tenacibaculum haliotis]MCT4698217.1 hypothetical protein [Tenacibaculum haliotis]